jgi:ankyrin repeat protein
MKMAAGRSIPEAQQKIVDENFISGVSSNDREKMELCLKKGADVNARLPGWSNRTALMIAAARGREDTVVFLLARNPDLFLKDSDGKTVFDVVGEISDTALRKKINFLLLSALPDPAPATPEASAEESVTLTENFPVLKPIALQPKKGGGSFQL